jgi:F5/8 type C domain
MTPFPKAPVAKSAVSKTPAFARAAVVVAALVVVGAGIVVLTRLGGGPGASADGNGVVPPVPPVPAIADDDGEDAEAPTRIPSATVPGSTVPPSTSPSPTTTTTTTTVPPTTVPETTVPVAPPTTEQTSRFTLDRSGWKLRTSHSGDEPRVNALDGDIETRWSSGESQAPGMYFQLDLGDEQIFSRLSLELGAIEPSNFPSTYDVFVSNNPGFFGTPLVSGSGSTVIDVDLPEVSARYVRIVQTGADKVEWWSIAELNLYTTNAVPPPPPTTVPPSTTPQPSAPATTTPSGSSGSSGSSNVAIDRSRWVASASVGGSSPTAPGAADPMKAVDGQIDTRWGTGVKQSSGQFFLLDFGQSITFGRIELTIGDVNSNDSPRGYEVYASNDPNDFGSAIASGVGSQVTDIKVEATTARYVKIVQTGTDDFYWWSIYEMNVFSP